MKRAAQLFIAAIIFVSCGNQIDLIVNLDDINYPDPLVEALLINCVDTIWCSDYPQNTFVHKIGIDTVTRSLIDVVGYGVERKQYGGNFFVVAVSQISDVQEDYAVRYAFENGLISQKWHMAGGNDWRRHQWPVEEISEKAEKTVFYKLDSERRIRLSIDSAESRYELFSYDSVNRLVRKTRFIDLETPTIEITTTYEFDDQGTLQVVQIKDWLAPDGPRFKRYCFENNKLDQIQHTDYVEQCVCKE